MSDRGRAELRARPGGVAVRRSGDRALLLDGMGQGAPPRVRSALLADPLPGQDEVVVGTATVLVQYRHRWPDPVALRARAGAAVEAGPAGGTVSHLLDVVYDGEDLEAVARTLGMSEEAVVRWHGDSPWAGEFIGFAPGFAYLTRRGDDRPVARRASPRTRVPSGSVALAGPYSAVYPRESPGGWQLIGRTDAAVWDEDRDRPALVLPGDEVRFRAVRALARASVVRSAPASAPARPALRVLSPGALALVQDGGRPRSAALGVSPSGASDAAALGEANRVVGNLPGAAGIEAIAGGVELEALADVVVAAVGRGLDVSRADVHGGAASPRPAGRAFALRPGERVRVDAAGGFRFWLALRGGIDAPRALGSRATDTLSGLGPPPLRAGSVVGVGAETSGAVALPPPDGGDAAAPSRRHGVVRLRVVLGPRDDWFTADAVARFLEREWEVDPRSNRVGARLRCPGEEALERRVHRELPSEGVVAGSIQVPSGGEPILFLADHPVTGGYPVIAVVVADDLPLAAQLAPGARVRFTNIQEI